MLLLAAVAIGVSGLVWQWKSKGPVYGGKTVAEWFNETSLKPDWLFSSSSTSARDAFEHFGAQAQPFLLHWAQRQPPALSKLHDRWLVRLPKPLQWLLPSIQSQQWYVERRRLALQMLGFVEQWEKRRQDSDAPTTTQLTTSALPVLTRAMSDRDRTIRFAAVLSLRNLGEHAWPAIPNLLESLDDTDLRVAICAMQALGNMGMYATNAIVKLAAIARDPTNPLRAEAVRTLGELGPAARLASPVLSSLLIESTVEVQNPFTSAHRPQGLDPNVVRAVGRWPLKFDSASLSTPPNDAEILKSPRLSVGPLVLDAPRNRMAYTYSFGVAPTVSGLPIPKNSKTQLRSSAVQTNSSIAVPNDREFQGIVAGALVRIGGITDEAASALERLLEGPSRDALAVALWRRNPDHSTPTRYLIAALRSDDWLQKMRATRLLADQGTNAAFFLPELRRLLDDSDLLVRRCATSAVVRVGLTPP